ncbi:MAG: energy-coupling factor transporter ATPase [Sulfobacillus sp.]
MESIISIEELAFEYLDGNLVLKDVSLDIAKGSYVALLGANGSGKSTLARHVNGILVPKSGRVQVAGMDTQDDAQKMEIRKLVGMVFQHPDNQIVATTVEDDVAFGLENFNVAPKVIEERVTWALRETGLSAVRKRPPHLLSGGQKQRLAIAGALAMQQQVLVLDEATSMLDAKGRDDVLQMVRHLHQNGTTIITVTHHMEEVLEADQVVVLNQGMVVMTGTPREIFRNSRRLRQLNLDVPAIAQVSAKLHEVLPEVSADAITPEELMTDLAALSTRPKHGKAASHRDFCDDGPTAKNEIIQMQEVSHVYLQGTPLEHHALRRADLTVRSGEALAIVGATGSGKSTVMQHLNGIYRPQRGTVWAVDVDLGSPHANIAKVRQEIGMLFQNPEDQLFEQLVGDDVAYGPLQMRMDLKEVRRRVRWALEMVGLDFDTFKDRPVFALSGGEKRRAALAGVLALRPKVLVLDEPTAGLDPRSASDLLDRLRHLKKEEHVSIVFVTHNIEEVLNLADRVIIMHDGQTKGTYSIEQIMDGPSLLLDHGFEAPPILMLQQMLREQGFGSVFGRTPDQVSDMILQSLGLAFPRNADVLAEEGL